MQVKRRSVRSFSERNLAVIGVVGSVVLVLALALAVNLGKLPFISGGTQYSAYFSDAGAIGNGDDVLVAGMPVGKVTGVHLDGTKVAVKFKITDGNLRLGNETDAAIITETVLGKAALQLDSAGAGRLDAGVPIPETRTRPQYDVTAALSGLTNTTEAIDVKSLTKAIDTVNDSFSDSPGQLKAALTGVAALSKTISSRDAGIQKLLARASSVTGLLKSRNAQVTTLLKDGSKLLAVIDARRTAVTQLLTNTTAIAAQLHSLVVKNNGKLGPGLTSLNKMLDLLNKNTDNLKKAIDGLNAYAATLGNAISSGPYFDGWVQNLTSPGSLLPILSGLLAGGSK